MKSVQPYWFDMTGRLGAGVTAHSEADAIAIFEAAFDRQADARPHLIKDASELDQKHVVPNMGNLLMRGVWFPRGYEALKL